MSNTLLHRKATIVAVADGGLASVNQTGTAGADTLTGGTGPDTLSGLGGSDELNGGAGDDLLDGGDGKDTLNGGAGNDTFIQSVADDYVWGGSGIDLVSYANAPTAVQITMNGTPPQARIPGTGISDLLYEIESVQGSAFNDYIVAAVSGSGRLAGGGGADTITGQSFNVSFYGEDGDDSLSSTIAGGRLDGGDGADSLRGVSGGADTLDGGAGADVLMVAGADEIWTGAGADRIEVADVASPTASNTPDIRDWAAGDVIVFGGGTLAGDYAEMTAADFASAKASADSAIAAGAANFIVVQIGADLFAFADSAANNGAADAAVRIRNATLADFDISRFVAVGGQSAAPTVPSVPAAPTSFGVRSLTGTLNGNLDQLVMPDSDVFVTRTSTLFRVAKAGFAFEFTGSNFTYNAAGNVAGGVISGLSIVDAATGFALSTTVGTATLTFIDDVDETKSFLMTYLSSNDYISGGAGADLIRGYLGNDQLFGGEGANSIYGGLGNDLIYATGPDLPGTGASTFLRGEDGNDYMVGGVGFDDVHGNQGEDTERGGAGDDWVVGGQGSDLLFGDSGLDIVLGNLGNDSCVGGADRDVVRGGQGNDIVWGDHGDDWLSGDRGDDTLVGGAGADTFHSFAEAGIDRIEDFKVSEGDVLNLLAGSTYTLDQVGSNIVVTVSGQAQVTLVGVQLSSLPAGWLIIG